MYQILGKKTKRSRRHERILAQYSNIDEVVRYVRENNLGVLPSPYVFTHIPLSDDTIITQEVMGMICTPKKLYELLTNII